MNGYDALKLLKKGAKIRKRNWQKNWYLFIDVATTNDQLPIETFFVNYSDQMHKQIEQDNHKYFEVIDDLLYSSWDTYEDDED